MVQNSTSFPHTFFGVISMVEKSALFPRTFFGVISLVEISTLFPRTFFDVISMVGKTTLFLLTFFDVISLVEKFTLVFTYFFRCNFDGPNIHVVCTCFFGEILTGRNSTSFLVKLQANENIRGGFPLLVILKTGCCKIFLLKAFQ